MGRKFKCRNGTILEEAIVPHGMSYTDAGYQSDYKVLYDPTRHLNKGERLHLVCIGEPLFPKGYSHGKGYDIVEELKPRKQKKQTVTNTVVQDSWCKYFKGKLSTEPKEFRALKFDKDNLNMVKLPNGWQYYCPPENRSMLMKALVDSMTDTDEIVLDVTRGQGYTIDYDHDDYPMFRDIQGKPTLKRIIIKKV